MTAFEATHLSADQHLDQLKMSLPRETLKWILSLDLSYPVKNVRREFANGFLFAEVLSRYYPADVHMHSFENVASSTRKKQNWQLLEKLFKKKQIPIEKRHIEGVMAAEEDAAIEMLQALHAFIHSPAFSAGDVGDEAGCGYADQGAYGGGAMQQATWDYQGNQVQQAPMFIPMQQQPAHAAFMAPGPPKQQVLHPQQPAMAQQGPCGMQPMYGYQQQLGYMQYMHPQQPYAGMYADGGMYGGVPSEVMQAQGPPAGYASSAPSGQKSQRVAAAKPSAVAARPAAKQAKGYSKAPPQGPAPPAAQHSIAPQYSEMMNPYEMVQGNDGMMYGQMDAGWGEPSYAAAFAGAGGGGGHPAAYGQLQQAYHGQYAEDWMDVGYQQMQAGPGGAEDVPFSKRRPIDYQPYDMKDFEDKAYNVKKAGNRYWELGRLGPDLETPELQEKREKAEKLKALAAQVREENMKKAAVAAAKPRREAPKEPTAREKALEFAKNVPKPDAVRPEGSQPASGAKPAGALTAAVRAGPGASSKGSRTSKASYAAPSPLQLLEAQHAADKQKVEAIRAELARLL